MSSTRRKGDEHPKTPSRLTRRALVFLLAVSAAIVAACGGGGDTAAAEETAASETGILTGIPESEPLPRTSPTETLPPLRIELPSEGVLGFQSSGQAVETLQRALLALGYQPGAADEFFGRQTRKAVVAFQRDHELPDDGIVGPKTAAAINIALEELATTTGVSAG